MIKRRSSSLNGTCLLFLFRLLLLWVSTAAVHADEVRAPGDIGQAVDGGHGSEVSAGPLNAPAAPVTDQGGMYPGAGTVSDSGVLRAEQWEQGRSGDIILAIPVIRDVVGRWLEDTDMVIELRYPGGEEGEFWVHELSDWLIALGIPADKLITSPGSGGGDIIRLQLSHAY